jgi:tape measure domain-containing protein
MAEKFILSILVELRDKLSAPLDDMQKKVVEFGDSMKKAGKEISKVGENLTKKLTLPLIAIGGVAIKTAADFEKLEVAFTTMLGSADKAQELLQQIEDFSAATPFQLPNLAEGAKQLLAFGSRAEDVVNQLRMLGNVAGGDQEKLTSVVRAFGLIQAKGKASMRELNMVLSAGVPILKALQDQMGVNSEDLFKMISAGELSFDKFNEALINLTTGTGQFAGLIEAQSQTLSGLFSTLQDNLGLLGKEIADTFMPALKDIVQGAMDIVKWFRGLDDNTKQLIGTLGIVAAATGPVLFVFGKLLGIFGNVISAIPKIVGLMKGLNLAMNGMLGPIGLVIIGFTSLIALSNEMNKSRGPEIVADRLKQAAENGEDLNKVIRDSKGLFQLTDEQIQNIIESNETLKGVYNDQLEILKKQRRETALGQAFLRNIDVAIASYEKMLKAMEDAEKENEDINDSIDSQTDSIKDLNKEYDKQVENLEKIKRLEKERIFREIATRTGTGVIEINRATDMFGGNQSNAQNTMPVTDQPKQETEITVKVVADKDTQATVEDIKSSSGGGRGGVPNPFNVNVFTESYIGPVF